MNANYFIPTERYIYAETMIPDSLLTHSVVLRLICRRIG